MDQTAEGFAVVAVREIAAEPCLDQLQNGTIRKSECMILGFLVYAVVLGASLPAAQPIRHLVTMLNAGILIGHGIGDLRRSQAKPGLRPFPRDGVHGAHHVGVPRNGLVRSTPCEPRAGS
jgi:hypothetical protein